MMMQVTTGVSSLDRARASTPPTDLVRPSLANSRTNCNSAAQLYQYPKSAVHGVSNGQNTAAGDYVLFVCNRGRGEAAYDTLLC